jgi:hypothetical protein
LMSDLYTQPRFRTCGAVPPLLDRFYGLVIIKALTLPEVKQKSSAKL